MGTGHTYDIRIGSTQLYGVLQQKKHTQERQGPCQPAPPHVFHLNTGRRLLWVSNKQLCLWITGMARTTRHLLEDRQTRARRPFESSRKTVPPILKEEEATPLYHRLHAGHQASSRPEHATGCLSLRLPRDMFLRDRPCWGIHNPETQWFQPQCTCLPGLT